MERDEVIQKGQETMRQGEIDALGMSFDEGQKTGDAIGYARAQAELVTEDQQALIDAAVAQQRTLDQAKLDAVQGQLDEALAQVAKVTSDDESDKAAIAAAQAELAKSKDVIAKVLDLVDGDAPAPTPAPSEEPSPA